MTGLQSYLDGLQRFGIQPGLERIQALLERAGNPHLHYPIVLVGGTNGKGSTCEFLARLLAAEGRKTGLYTSPHLYRWNERIRVLGARRGERAVPPDGAASGGEDRRLKIEDRKSRRELFPGIIADAELDALLEEALPHLQAVAAALGQSTEFETLTFLGLWHFARVAVDVAVIEVGLGGRWDATNVTEPVVSVITHVALDHQDRLGHTVEEIARDKVEIARPHRVLVTAETKPSVLHVFEEFCAAREVKLWPFQAPDWSNDRLALDQCLRWLPSIESVRDLLPSGNGEPPPDYQTINALTAATAKFALDAAPASAPGESPHEYSHSIYETSGDLRRLSAVLAVPEFIVPGRAEVLRERPLCLIDGANNPDGARLLAAHLRERMTSGLAPRRLLLVLGILADKDYPAMVQELAPWAEVVIATQSGSPRAANADAIANEARRYCRSVETAQPVTKAVERALQLAAPEDVVCITGSFYTIAEVDREAVAMWSANGAGRRDDTGHL
jgi:dihydrofolate synthase / folylpolyglutamate synthase